MKLGYLFVVGALIGFASCRTQSSTGSDVEATPNSSKVTITCKSEFGEMVIKKQGAKYAIEVTEDFVPNSTLILNYTGKLDEAASKKQKKDVMVAIDAPVTVTMAFPEGALSKTGGTADVEVVAVDAEEMKVRPNGATVKNTVKCTFKN